MLEVMHVAIDTISPFFKPRKDISLKPSTFMIEAAMNTTEGSIAINSLLTL